MRRAKWPSTAPALSAAQQHAGQGRQCRCWLRTRTAASLPCRRAAAPCRHLTCLDSCCRRLPASHPSLGWHAAGAVTFTWQMQTSAAWRCWTASYPRSAACGRLACSRLLAWRWTAWAGCTSPTRAPVRSSCLTPRAPTSASYRSLAVAMTVLQPAPQPSRLAGASRCTSAARPSPAWRCSSPPAASCPVTPLPMSAQLTSPSTPPPALLRSLSIASGSCTWSSAEAAACWCGARETACALRRRLPRRPPPLPSSAIAPHPWRPLSRLPRASSRAHSACASSGASP
mmetsp:Transcript_16321/g.41772  ORF Transcript_16321/g.41772 Transcript_16321/m.41772 type:complete len:286 (+) Transcript_16321:88-945(+)